ncbi:MAG: hypothetical protein CLLPBCKN_007195 [Chroococcidiopsis cubana SAG 39.79]|uniref:Uncharacterized protein n=1 Tax=Chroococcidiopsis cubana SAG 39.79 TaxID=388085 RepID=A0AB37URH7_9CYAN|nr:hypothetical protein [Chroococcidiopsis cubana]MDZ4877760.1 hypothetical protein [Chroococcidiopsis cubana SAG 39.79]PSB62055.1 hypothetical protein C7B79_19630 [Chroococcidiopsis cubana CCALA 043]RUT14043.1 hypothetical protein DSM107010_05260 [Chroococcidiopsis cubana SAG 39.79]
MTTVRQTIPCPIACSCPTVADTTRSDNWGFTEPCPEDCLSPGDIISSPGGHFEYEIISYPFSRLYLDFRGLVRSVKGVEIIDTQLRQLYKLLFLLLASAISNNQIHLPIWLLLSLTGRLMPHLDNNAWVGYPKRRPIRHKRGNYLSYQRRLVDGQTVETFTLRWSTDDES